MEETPVETAEAPPVETVDYIQTTEPAEDTVWTHHTGTEPGHPSPEDMPAVPEDDKPMDFVTFLAKRAATVKEADAAFENLRMTKKFNRSDVIKTMLKLRRVVSMLDSLADVMVRDLMVVDQRFNMLEQKLFQYVQQLATTTTLLTDKKLISEEEIKTTWETKVRPALEAKMKAAQEPAPAPSGIVGLNGEELVSENASTD